MLADDEDIAMAVRSGLLREIEALQAEFEENRRKREDRGAAGEADMAFAETRRLLDGQVREIEKLVRALLEDTETAVGEHPLASVAGALALGILIGRLTA